MGEFVWCGRKGLEGLRLAGAFAGDELGLLWGEQAIRDDQRAQREVPETGIYRDLCGVGVFGCLGEGGSTREFRDAALRLLRGLEAALHVCRELAVSRSSPVSKCFVTRFGRAG